MFGRGLPRGSGRRGTECVARGFEWHGERGGLVGVRVAGGVVSDLLGGCLVLLLDLRHSIFEHRNLPWL